MECSIIPTFIETYQMKDISLCDRLIEYHKESPNKKKGIINNINYEEAVDISVKDSTDVELPPGKLSSEYFHHLQFCLEKYLNKYEYAAKRDKGFRVEELMRIQHYFPGGGFKIWHSERGLSGPSQFRHLVFMTYLNDVHNGGETEWLYYNYKTPARKGHTVIWPSDWMHVHRGIVSNTEEKYIITGWFSFYE